MDNANTPEYLDKIRSQVVENLRRTAFAPSVQMTDVPRDPLLDGMDDEADAIMDDLDEDENKDRRYTKRRFDQYIEKPGELSESEDEEENAANGVRPQPGAVRRRNRIDHRNIDSGLDSGIATPREVSSVPDQDEEMDLAADASADKPEETPAVERPQSTSHEEAPRQIDANGATEINDTGAVEAATGAESPASALSEAHSDVDMQDAAAPPALTEPTPTEETSGQEKTPPVSPPASAPAADEPAPAEPSPAPASVAPQQEETTTETKSEETKAEEKEQTPAAAGTKDQESTTAETTIKSEEQPEKGPAPESKEPEATSSSS
jgi:histone deacetylase 1/2